MDFIAGANDYILNDAMPYFIHTALELHTHSKKEKAYLCLPVSIRLKIFKIASNERKQELFCTSTKLNLPFFSSTSS